jgi:hypothetical protein
MIKHLPVIKIRELSGCELPYFTVTIRQEQFIQALFTFRSNRRQSLHHESQYELQTRTCSLPYCMKSLSRLLSLIVPALAPCALICALAVPAAAQKRQPSQTAAFPSLTTYNLAKAKLDLPSDFAAPLDLLLISFQPEQETQIETWMPVAQALQHTNFSLRWYRMPVSASENILFRLWDNASMRSDETDPETYPWIVPLYVDVNSFRRSLQIPTTHKVAVLLIDKKGHVLWRAEGPMTPDDRTSLAAAVAAQK